MVTDVTRLLRILSDVTGSSKGETGTVGVVGSAEYTGQPTLAALAALRTGSDVLRALVPQEIDSIVATDVIERVPDTIR